MRNKSLMLTAALGVVFLSGCTIKPMLIHETTAFPMQQAFEQKAVAGVVLDAARAKGWEVLKQEPGNVTLTYPSTNNKRYQTIHAVVRVEYDDKSFRIVHVSDYGLEKEPCNSAPEQLCIHRNYNRWIANLDLQIRNRLQSLANQKQ